MSLCLAVNCAQLLCHTSAVAASSFTVFNPIQSSTSSSTNVHVKTSVASVWPGVTPVKMGHSDLSVPDGISGDKFWSSLTSCTWISHFQELRWCLKGANPQRPSRGLWNQVLIYRRIWKMRCGFFFFFGGNGSKVLLFY